MSKPSESEERQLIADAEAARDDDSVIPVPAEIRPGKSATVVLSVRLPFERAQRLRQVAATRNLSLSELLDRAVDALMVTDPSLSASDSIVRLAIYEGLGRPHAETPGSAGTLRLTAESQPHAVTA